MPKTYGHTPVPKPEPEFRYKQCLVIRNDVKMSCGKRCAQAAHASIGAYKMQTNPSRKPGSLKGRRKWYSGQMMKGRC